MRTQRTLSYEVSANRPAPMVNLFHTDVEIQPTTFVVDLGNSGVNGHKFLDVAILRDSNDKLTTYKSEWNIPTYSSNTSFYFATLTDSVICLFKGTISDLQIELEDTFSYNFNQVNSELSLPHSHRL